MMNSNDYFSVLVNRKLAWAYFQWNSLVSALGMFTKMKLGKNSYNLSL
jgi:hypothetical protein